jgi:hypothetical protein
MSTTSISFCAPVWTDFIVAMGGSLSLGEVLGKGVAGARAGPYGCLLPPSMSAAAPGTTGLLDLGNHSWIT